MFNDLFKRPQHLVQQSIERVLDQMLKPFLKLLNREAFNEYVISSQNITT